jgi:hypothetical protein
VGQRLEARNDKSCRQRKESDEANRPGPGGGCHRFTLLDFTGLLERAPRGASGGEPDTGSSAADARHDPGRSPSHARRSRPGSRRDTGPCPAGDRDDRAGRARNATAGLLSPPRAADRRRADSAAGIEVIDSFLPIPPTVPPPSGTRPSPAFGEKASVHEDRRSKLALSQLWSVQLDRDPARRPGDVPVLPLDHENSAEPRAGGRDRCADGPPFSPHALIPARNRNTSRSPSSRTGRAGPHPAVTGVSLEHLPISLPLAPPPSSFGGASPPI